MSSRKHGCVHQSFISGGDDGQLGWSGKLDAIQAIEISEASARLSGCNRKTSLRIKSAVIAKLIQHDMEEVAWH